MTEVTAIQSMVTANAVKFEFGCQNEYKKTNPPPMRIGKMWWRQQDSSISGARLLAIGSGACSVTEVTGRTSCAVRNAPLSPVADTNMKNPTIQ